MNALILLLLAALQDPVVDFGPMVGHVGSDEARIWVKASGETSYFVVWSDRADLSNPRSSGEIKLDASTEFAGHVRIQGLSPSARYWYAPVLGGRMGAVAPYPSFMTAPPPGAKGKVRFAFGSCVGKDGVDAAACWGEMAERADFDLLLLLGDNHYADSTAPAKQRAAYASHRRPAGYREITRRTPTYAIWDDHDYGPNNSDGTTAGKEDSLRTFKEFWANPAYGEPDNPGVYFAFTRGDVDFILLDSRYYRTPNAAVEDGRKTMLGARQLAWLKERLAGSKAPVKIVGCGSEFQTQTQPDCWSSFLRERNEILAFIEEKGIQGVIFISGDRHFTAAYQVGGKHLEVTSGPLGSRPAQSREAPEMFYYNNVGKLYTVFEIDTAGETPAVTLEVYRAGEGRVWKRPFTWEEVTGAARIPRHSGPPPPK